MIARVVSITVPKEQVEDVKWMWKNEWGPLIIKQTGCLTHLFMHSRENPDKFLSLSLWANQEVVDHYVASPARQKIRDHHRGVVGVLKVETEVFDMVH